MRILRKLADKAISLVSEPVEYEPVINRGYDDMPQKKGKLVKFNSRRGEVPRCAAAGGWWWRAPVPAPVPEPTPPPQVDYYKPRIGRGMPRITPKTPRLGR